MLYFFQFSICYCLLFLLEDILLSLGLEAETGYPYQFQSVVPLSAPYILVPLCGIY